jgi:hypothetical protein
VVEVAHAPYAISRAAHVASRVGRGGRPRTCARGARGAHLDGHRSAHRAVALYAASARGVRRRGALSALRLRRPRLARGRPAAWRRLRGRARWSSSAGPRTASRSRLRRRTSPAAAVAAGTDPRGDRARSSPFVAGKRWFAEPRMHVSLIRPRGSGAADRRRPARVTVLATITPDLVVGLDDPARTDRRTRSPSRRAP